MNISRSVDIMADSAYVILTSDSKTTTGNSFIDDEIIASVDGPDMANYRIALNGKEIELMTDFMI